MSKALERHCFTVSLTMPSAVLLSVVMIVGGWGWPISMSIVRRTLPSFPSWKSPSISASAALDSTMAMMLLTMRMGPLILVGFMLGGGGIGTESPRKWKPPALERASDLLR